MKVQNEQQYSDAVQQLEKICGQLDKQMHTFGTSVCISAGYGAAFGLLFLLMGQHDFGLALSAFVLFTVAFITGSRVVLAIYRTGFRPPNLFFGGHWAICFLGLLYWGAVLFAPMTVQLGVSYLSAQLFGMHTAAYNWCTYGFALVYPIVELCLLISRMVRRSSIKRALRTYATSAMA